MADPITEEGDQSQIPEVEQREINRAAEARAAEARAEEEHAYSTETNEGNFQRIGELLLGGQIAGVEVGAAHGVNYHEVEETRKRNDERNYATTIAAQIAANNASIEVLEARNKVIDEMLQFLYGRRDELKAEDTAAEAAEHVAAQELTHAEAAEARGTEEAVAANAKLQKLEFQKEQAYDRLAAMGLPDSVVRIKCPQCESKDLEVAVFKTPDGKYYYRDPTKGGAQVAISNPEVIKEIESQIAAGKKTGDMVTQGSREELKMAAYEDALGRFLYLDQQTTSQAAKLVEHEQRLKNLEATRQKAQEILREIKDRRAEIAEELESIRTQTSALQAEKRQNQARIEALKKENLDLDRREGIVNTRLQRVDLVQNRVEELYEQDTLKYNEIVRAQIDYNNAFESVWKGSDFYMSSKETLQRNGVMMVTRDENDLHLQYAVHKDDKGYFYYDMEGARHTVSPKEIATLGPATKTIEDFKGNITVEEADVFMRMSAKDMSQAMKRANEIAQLAPDGQLKNEFVVSPQMMDVLYSRSMMAPVSEEEAEFEEAHARVESKLAGGKNISLVDLQEALKYAPPEIQDRVIAQLVENGVTFNERYEGVRPVMTPITISDSDRQKTDIQRYQDVKQQNDYLDNLLYGPPKVMYASYTPETDQARIMPAVFTGDMQNVPRQDIASPDFQNIPRTNEPRLILATNITVDGEPNPTNTDAFATAAGQTAAPQQGSGNGLDLNRNRPIVV
jgi:hypothetical protein